MEDSQREVIKYSASGFRDFTRIAGSDPTMWRDIFMANQDAVLDVLQRFNEDLITLQRAIRHGAGQTLFDWFTHSREVRQAVIGTGQAGGLSAKERSKLPPISPMGLYGDG